MFLDGTHGNLCRRLCVSHLHRAQGLRYDANCLLTDCVKALPVCLNVPLCFRTCENLVYGVCVKASVCRVVFAFMLRGVGYRRCGCRKLIISSRVQICATRLSSHPSKTYSLVCSHRLSAGDSIFSRRAKVFSIFSTADSTFSSGRGHSQVNAFLLNWRL